MHKTEILNPHAVIVGSGPTGLMAALLLNHCGIKIRILDKSQQQAHESRAFAIHARSLELLQNIGLVEEFLQKGTAASGVQIYIDGRKAAEMNLNDIGSTDSPYAFIFMLPQAEIEEILSTELKKRGVEIEHDTEVKGFTQNSQGVVVTAMDKHGKEEHIHTGYLLGADGAHSIVRNTLGFNFVGDAYPQNFLLADCTINWSLDYEFIKLFLHDNYFAAYLPLKGKKISRIITVETEEEITEKDAFKEVEKTFAQAVGSEVKLSNSVWSTRYRIHHRGVNKYSEGRVFLAGDAAHIHSPAGGQGMNTGLQDAANLAWKLALTIKNHPTNSKLLDTYNIERWPIGQTLLHFTDKLFARISALTRWQTTLRNIVMPITIKLISKYKFLKTKVFRFISQLGIHYKSNDFLLDDVTKSLGFNKKLSPGYRAPNALYKRNHDVFSLIKGYQFHVLALSKKALSLEEIDKIHQDLSSIPQDIGLPVTTHFIAHSLSGENKKIIQALTNQVFENYGLTDQNPFGLFLIRPDGYIAYRSNEISSQRLIKFLERFST